MGGVLLGSIVPVVPTGAVVSAAAAVATTTPDLSLPVVVLLSTLAALGGDLVTFAICRFGGPTAVRWVARGQNAERLEQVREQFGRRGGQIIVVGRLVPAGRIPVLLAAGALAYPWRRLLPAALVGSFIWAVLYSLLGIASGGLFTSPVLASLVAAVLVLLISALLALVARLRTRRQEAHAADLPPDSGRPPTSVVS
jgi:membrane protein DedA with SNARE-associated domain